MSSTTEQIRSAFLAAIMVLSVVAMSATLSGAVAAQEITVDDPQEVDVDDGGTITISSADTATINVDTIPDDWGVSQISDDGDFISATGEVNWDFGARGDRTVSFELTPPADASVGDTLTLTVLNDQAETQDFTVEVVDEPEPPADPPEETSIEGLTVSPKQVVDQSFASQNDGLLGVPFGVGPYPDEGDLSFGEVVYTHTATVDFNSTDEGETEQIEYDFSETTEQGLEFDVDEDVVENAFESVAGLQVSDVAVTPNSIIVEYEADQDVSGATISFDSTFSVDDPSEGIEEETSNRLDHTVEGPEGDSASDRYRLTTIGPVTFEESDLSEDYRGSEATPATSWDGEDAVTAWAGSTFTFVANDQASSIEIHEAVRDSDDQWTISEETEVLQRGTQPGSIQSIDTAQLDNPDGQYFITFNRDYSQQFYVDLRSLDFDASPAEDSITTEDNLEIDVSSDDIGTTPEEGAVEAWFFEAGDDDISDVITVEEGSFDGDGEETLSVNPGDDLTGTGSYYAVVRHEESGTTVETETVEVTDPLDQDVEVVSPQSSDAYARGDIVEVELELTNTELATLTLGDRASGQNFELNVTVRDNNNDGTVNFLVNTFQLGDGEASGTVEYEGQEIAGDDWGDAQHGVRTTDGDATTIVDVNAHNGSLQIGGGSNDVPARTVVIAQGNYDLVASPGDTPAKDSRATDRNILRIEERSTGDVTAWQAPAVDDPAEISDIELVGGIETAIENNVVTPQEGNHADGDFLILQVESSGLEGILANEIEENNNIDTDLEEFLNREENHEVTEPFTQSDLISIASQQTVEDVGETIQDAFEDDQRNVPRDTTYGLPATIELLGQEEQSVLADTDELGNLEEYFVLTPVNEDTITDNSTADTSPSRDVSQLSDSTVEELIEVHPNLDDSLSVADARQFFVDNADSEIDTVELPTDFQTQFTLQAGVDDTAADDFPLNDLFDEGVDATLNWTLNEDVVDLDRLEDGTLTLPSRDNVEVTGTTNIAASTTLQHFTQTASGEDPPFFNDGTFQIEYVEDGDNEFSFELDQPLSEHAGQEFTMDIYRVANDQLVTPDEESIEGQISQPFEIYGHEFADQEAGGQAVTVDSVNVSDAATLQIQDADGNVLGEEDLVAGNNEDIGILLDETITETQELDSVILDEGTEPDDDLARVTATYTIIDDAEADFSVSNLSPIADTVEPGTEVTVTADVSNVGDAAGTTDVEFRLDGETIATQELSLDAGASDSVEFTTTVDEAGEYTHSVWTEDDEAQGQLTVEESEPEPPADDDTTDDADNGTDDDDGADDGGPGFGIAAALIAVIGAALLAYRRREA